LTELIGCEFFLFRYVPDAVKEEFVNIGILVRQVADVAEPLQPLLRFTRDWSRVRAIDPDADVALLEVLEVDIVGRLMGDSGRAVLDEFLESLSNSIQIVGPRACLALTLEAELERLMRLYVESPAPRPKQADS
jgi:hypothetical protein